MVRLAIASLASCLTSVAGSAISGFCYGNEVPDGTARFKADYVRLFNLAKNLPNVPVQFNSARLFTSLQPYTGAPIEAFAAAVETNTTLLLGIWHGNGTRAQIDIELAAIKTALDTHGQKLASLVVGVSVGNEDVFRNSTDCTSGCMGNANAETVTSTVDYVRQYFTEGPLQKYFTNTPLIGHVDVAKQAPNVDQGAKGFVGMNAYPFWAGDRIDNANNSFFGSLTGDEGRSGGREVWITETGWPAKGLKSSTDNIASVENAQSYWNKVGCSLFGKYNLWWYELEDDTPTDEGRSWGILDSGTGNPRFDLSCSGQAPAPSQAPQSSALAAPPASSAPPPSTPRADSSSPSMPSSAPLAASSSAKAPLPSAQQSSTPPLSQPSGGQGTTTTITETQCVTVYSAGSGQLSTYTTNTLKSGAQGCSSPPPVRIKKGETTVAPSITVAAAKSGTPPPASVQPSASLHTTSAAGQPAPSGTSGGFTYPTPSGKRRWLW
ncbi:glycoside hydrolase family 17 protein [Lophiostoma macrostomum CBS 122681]|uniref:glucan endo-1,3-beta-D-glucosidase n=1 Tax=Lophiostoma macrostomum CBS 122681 TaxID=1314788 RepID=A0A6A6SQH2_9PLEO|nr:glycoside hydrolase family 17 protein [Lophiostoma macrostomum CBS 122681]